ncbi:hypothetical protein [Sphingomonas sp. CFBP 13720]|uniref:hypothetical protein n=1 Tax=Sphingomonas sp. CFBP 13720 TaxID=2775302 RepID=UPI001781C4CD|nr:hypothetical protein [Sphingomonas sp. CFBP 13720]MBD8678363.1 hypothetical protein [Sphingomonas sp. CFBP 13720]
MRKVFDTYWKMIAGLIIAGGVLIAQSAVATFSRAPAGVSDEGDRARFHIPHP